MLNVYKCPSMPGCTGKCKGGDMEEIVMAIVAIGAIVYLEREALKQGINGKILRGSIAAIALLGGMAVDNVVAVMG